MENGRVSSKVILCNREGTQLLTAQCTGLISIWCLMDFPPTSSRSEHPVSESNDHWIIDDPHAPEFHGESGRIDGPQRRVSVPNQPGYSNPRKTLAGARELYHGVRNEKLSDSGVINT